MVMFGERILGGPQLMCGLSTPWARDWAASRSSNTLANRADLHRGTEAVCHEQMQLRDVQELLGRREAGELVVVDELTSRRCQMGIRRVADDVLQHPTQIDVH